MDSMFNNILTISNHMMHLRRNKFRAFIIALAFTTACQKPSFGQALESYISQGLRSNVVLKQKQITARQAEYGLAIAERLFLPSADLLADYTSGHGGRNISLPMGDLLNPVFRSLNELTGSDAFPEVQNVSETFFPDNFYDARVRLSVPILNTDLIGNRKIQKHAVTLKELELAQYKRELVYRIKATYYQHASAAAMVTIREGTLKVIGKNLTATRSLVQNGSALPSSLARMMSEKAAAETNLINARHEEKAVRRYFNFLINREPEAAIEEDVSAAAFPPEPDTLSVATGNREELTELKTLHQIHQSALQQSQLSWLPKVSGFLDLGSQASDWNYNSQSRYYLAGVRLSFPLYHGSQIKLTTGQQRLECEKTALEYDNSREALAIAAKNARELLKASYETLKASQAQQRSAQSYFALIEKGYAAGVNSLVEFIDAQNQLTASEIRLTICSFEVLIAKAKAEREFATYTIE